jgi:hypothetical protein
MIGRAGRRGSANASGGPRYVIPSAMPPVLASSVTPFSPGGKWQCTWGPATDPDDTNLVFVATCAIVVIRGTDVDTGDICGIIKQAFEDFTVIFQSTPPWLSSDSGVYVVDRTLAGLEMIQGLTSGDQSLEAYLTSPANGNPVLVAAGHSLGGCLTTVTAVAELRLGPGRCQIADRSGGLRRAHGGKSSLRGLLHLHIPLLSGLLQRDEDSAGRLVESGRGLLALRSLRR